MEGNNDLQALYSDSTEYPFTPSFGTYINNEMDTPLDLSEQNSNKIATSTSNSTAPTSQNADSNRESLIALERSNSAAMIQSSSKVRVRLTTILG